MQCQEKETPDLPWLCQRVRPIL